MSKTPGPLAYPNLITDHHTVTKLREMIDHANALKVTADQAASQTTKNAAAIAALPAYYLSPNDVNAQIKNWSGSSAFTDALKSVGLSPTTPAAAAATTRLEVVSAMHWGKRTDAPQLGREDAGFLYYVADYLHLAMWDGWSWLLLDGGGGYFVDTELDLGAGWQLCDGSVTDYLVNDTPTLEIAPFTTYRYRGLRRHNKRYFRR